MAYGFNNDKSKVEIYSKTEVDSEIGNVNNRIDNIITSPAPTEQEIIDARLGADGVTYPSLGDAIRDQVSDLKSDISDIDDALFDSESIALNWELGSIGSGGGDITSNTAIRTKTGDEVVLPVGTVISVSSSSYEFAVAKYKTNASTRTSWSSDPYTIESGWDYFRIAMRKSDQSTLVDTSISSNLNIPPNRTSKLTKINDDINELDNSVNEAFDFIGGGAIAITAETEQGLLDGSGVEGDSTSRLRTKFIEIKTGGFSYRVPSGFEFLAYFYSSDKSFIDRDSWKQGFVSYTSIDAPYLRVLIRKTDQSTLTPSDLSSITVYLNTIADYFEITKYVATTGSDSNDGSKDSPYATIQKAINNGSVVYVADGTYKGQTISVNNKDKLSILPSGSGFTIDNSDTITLSEDIGTGLLKATKTFPNSTNWYAVFISQTKDPERTGTQTLTYNVILWEVGANSVKLKPVLTLAECQTTVGSFYYDGTYVYVHKSQNGATYKFLINEDVSVVDLDGINKLHIENMGVLYSDAHTFSIQNIKDGAFKNCKAGYSAYGGGFRTNPANVEFTNCEAFGMCSDGFGLSSGGHTVFKDCYAHDNGDDGISHHQNCTGTIFGGEFCGNGKGGITPAYGAEVNIYNAICYDNRYGIYFVASSSYKTDKVCNIVGCAMYDNSGKDLKMEYYNVREYLCKHTTADIDANSTLTTI